MCIRQAASDYYRSNDWHDYVIEGFVPVLMTSEWGRFKAGWVINLPRSLAECLVLMGKARMIEHRPTEYK